MKARPVTVETVCNLAETNWYGAIENFNVRDLELNSILVLRLNMKMRFDEISKLCLKYVSKTSNGAVLTLVESIKNSTIQRSYSIREWNGNISLRSSVLINFLTALYTWRTIRRGSYVPFFVITVRQVRE